MKNYISFLFISINISFCAPQLSDFVPEQRLNREFNFIVKKKYHQEPKDNVVEGPSLSRLGSTEMYSGFYNYIYELIDQNDTLKKDLGSFHFTINKPEKILIVPENIGEYYYVGKSLDAPFYFQHKQITEFFAHLSAHHEFVVETKTSTQNSFFIYGNRDKNENHSGFFEDVAGEIFNYVQIGDTLLKAVNEFDIVVKRDTSLKRFPYYYNDKCYWGKRYDLPHETPYLTVERNTLTQNE